MKIHYQGTQKGVATDFTLKIIGNNLSKTSSNYQVQLLVGANHLPIMTTEIHQSLYNCLKEIYLFRKSNQIVFDEKSEEVDKIVVPYDLVLFDHNKGTLFMN